MNQMIQNLIQQDALYTDTSQIYAILSALASAHAPANGCQLPGAIGDTIRTLANQFGLRLSTDERLLASGNIGLEIGASKPDIDLVITAHMDRPSFRVLSVAEKTLYPICAIRIDGSEYRTGAKAVHFVDGQVRQTAVGQIVIRATQGDYHITFEASSGELHAGDTVLMDVVPQRRGDDMIATGLDNTSGVALALLTSRLLQSLSADLTRRGRRLLIVLTDQEEGPPIGLFGQGAARLSHVIAPPLLGFMNLDAHNVDQAAGIIPGAGVSHGFVSGRGRGAVVPLHYQATAEQLAQQVNRDRPATVCMNYGYISRSDDMLLTLWSRCLGLVGVPLANAHTTEETINLRDMVSAVYWLSTFVMQMLDAS
jgi:putative aminopeptidase FrvX